VTPAVRRILPYIQNYRSIMCMYIYCYPREGRTTSHPFFSQNQHDTNMATGTHGLPKKAQVFLGIMQCTTEGALEIMSLGNVGLLFYSIMPASPITYRRTCHIACNVSCLRVSPPTLVQSLRCLRQYPCCRTNSCTSSPDV
jgi:hypothetical protein